MPAALTHSSRDTSYPFLSEVAAIRQGAPKHIQSSAATAAQNATTGTVLRLLSEAPVSESLRFSSKVNIMTTLPTVQCFRALVIALIVALAAGAPASAHGGGGRAGGFGFHGGRFGGFHAGYGYRGGIGGRYGGWYGGYGGWAWPGYGLFLATLPYDYSTYWWNSMPYYYADDNYYRWDGSIGEFESVNPPPGVLRQAEMQPTATELFAYPKNGQSTEQQAQDRQQCRSWAESQTGFQAAQSPTAAALARRQDYLRAQSACLQGRGYSVR